MSSGKKKQQKQNKQRSFIFQYSVIYYIIDLFILLLEALGVQLLPVSHSGRLHTNYTNLPPLRATQLFETWTCGKQNSLNTMTLKWRAPSAELYL